MLGLLHDVRVVGHVNILKGGFVGEFSEVPDSNCNILKEWNFDKPNILLLLPTNSSAGQHGVLPPEGEVGDDALVVGNIPDQAHLPLDAEATKARQSTADLWPVIKLTQFSVTQSHSLRWSSVHIDNAFGFYQSLCHEERSFLK